MEEYYVDGNRVSEDSNGNGLGFYLEKWADDKIDQVIGVNFDGNFEFLQVNTYSETEKYVWEVLYEDEEYPLLEFREREPAQQRINQDEFTLIDYVLERAADGEKWRWVDDKIKEKITEDDLRRYNFPVDVPLEPHCINNWMDRHPGDTDLEEAIEAFNNSVDVGEIPRDNLQDHSPMTGKYHSESDLVFLVDQRGVAASVWHNEWVKDRFRYENEPIPEQL